MATASLWPTTLMSELASVRVLVELAELASVPCFTDSLMNDSGPLPSGPCHLPGVGLSSFQLS